MDKHTQNQKIKIKINGEERPFKEEMEIHDWKSGKKEVAASTENVSEEDQFDWVLPEVDENQIPEFKKIHYTKKSSSIPFSKKINNKNNRQFTKLFFSTVTAVTIGVLIGLFMLKVVIYQSNSNEKASTNEHLNANTSPVKSNGKSTVIQIPSLTAALVQGGVFNNPDAVVQSIKEKGLPAVVLPMNNQQYIYIGVAGNIESAKILASEYKKKEVDVFAKEINFDGKTVSISSKDEENFIMVTIPLFEELANEIANAYLSGNVNSESFSKVKTKMGQISSFKKINNKQLDALKKNQLESYASLVKFQSSEDKKELIQAQNFLLSYLQIINALK